ncbi:alcohol dehydrogenase-like 1 protein [Tanacetum coccineum]
MGVEDTSHLFFSYVVALAISRLICRWWNVSWSPVDSYSGWLEWFNSIRLGSKLKGILEAAVVHELGRSVMVEEIKVDPPKATEVRIKMLFASICHSDILCFDGFPTPLFPRIPGHEGVGMVESVGEDIKTKLKPGDIVMPLLVGECGQCLNCKSGRTNLCLAYPLTLSGLMLDGTSRMSIAKTGETIYHHFSCSTWSEYMVIDINYVLKIDPKMHLPYASFLSCGFTTGFGASWKETQITEGSVVAVNGLGAVGLGAIKGAQMQGASKIIGIDVNENKAAKGKAFGMTHFINPKDHPNQSVSDIVRDITYGLGVDYCFECTGISSLLKEIIEASKIVHNNNQFMDITPLIFLTDFSCFVSN